MGSTENLHLVERLTRVSADAINYQVTFDDATTWARSWTASLRLTRTAERIYEVACHEGNSYSMEGVLAGARAEEKTDALQPPSSPAAAVSLNFDYFKTKVQPIFLAKRPGHARCIACHAARHAAAPAAARRRARPTWTEEESRKNFDAVQRVVVPGSLKSRLLVHPLAEAGRRRLLSQRRQALDSQNDPEWQTLKAWVLGDASELTMTTERVGESVAIAADRLGTARCRRAAAAKKVRIIQTNSAGDNVHVIDPATNKVVGVIDGIEVNHGAGGRARRQPHLRQRRSREHARRRRRARR